MKTRTALFATSLIASLPIFFAAGCGGGGASLGHNSNVQVILTSDDLADLEVIVSPRRGGPDDFDRCSIDSPNVWCDTQAGNRTDIIRFTTNSEASANPFYVWVRNFSNRTRFFTLEVRMDGTSQYFSNDSVGANRTDLYVQIRRNNASAR
jgi:hypothetical protein